MRSKRSTIFAAALAAMLAISSVALADHEEPREEDTIVSFGYDEINHILAIHQGDNDTPWICDFTDGALTAGYGEIVDGFLEIESLMSGEDEWEFGPRDDHEVGDAYEPAEDPSLYSDGECVLAGAVLAGPNGQINHGQFMKIAKSLFEGKVRGCIVRELAKSDIGKTDATKLRTSEVDEEFEPGEEGEVAFTTFEADCSKPNKKADKERPGKSGDAPGHNKGD